MPADPPIAVHATVVAIGHAGLLIRGRSKSGKSRLALALIGASTPRQPIRLVGDDRVLLSQGSRGLVARPHPRIAGFIEYRGLGIVGMPHRRESLVVGLVELGEAPPARDIVLVNLPSLCFVEDGSVEVRRDRALEWLSRLTRRKNHTLPRKRRTREWID